MQPMIMCLIHFTCYTNRAAQFGKGILLPVKNMKKKESIAESNEQLFFAFLLLFFLRLVSIIIYIYIYMNFI